MQSRVDDYFLTFSKAVAKGRGVPIAQVRNGMGQGRVLGADAALEQNLVDGIVTLDEAIRKMLANVGNKTNKKNSRLERAMLDLAIV